MYPINTQTEQLILKYYREHLVVQGIGPVIHMIDDTRFIFRQWGLDDSYICFLRQEVNEMFTEMATV